jgi:3-oxoacyl-[acyl-carrier-protein] synthase-3
LVQNIIGAKNACAVDTGAACTGFVNALDIARSYLALGEYKKILVVAGEMLSRQVDFTDRGSCVLFGDGAGAVVVEASDKLYTSYLGATGEDYKNMALHCAVNYQSNNPFAASENISPPLFLEMDGKEVYKFASDIMPKAVTAVCERAGVELSEVDLLIPHQANVRIIKSAMRNLAIPMEKVYVNLHTTGNISSACIPVCLDELYKSNRLKDGAKVCMVAFGAGLTYGSIIIEI